MTNKEDKDEIGVSKLLPPEAREILTNAAAEASRYEDGSIKRKRIIEVAIERVRYDYPHYFKNGNHCGQ